jgi:hypothetical protein
MSTVTVARTNLITTEVVAALRDGLGAGYNVLPGMSIVQLPLRGSKQGSQNTIVVGTGDNRIVKAQVTITPRDGRTELRIRPGGFTLSLLVNTFGIAREVRRVLASAPSLTGR